MRSRVLAACLPALLILLLLLPASQGFAAECTGTEADDVSCFEADASVDSGNTGDTGDTGDGGEGGGGGDSGDASAGDGVGGPGGSAGPGGTGGGNGGGGGGGGAAGGSGLYAGATVEGNKVSPGPAQQGGAGSASTVSTGDSLPVIYGGGGGGTQSSGVGAGGSGGTCQGCTIVLGGSDMVNVSSWQLQPAKKAENTHASRSEPEGPGSSSVLVLAGLLSLILFVKAPQRLFLILFRSPGLRP